MRKALVGLLIGRRGRSGLGWMQVFVMGCRQAVLDRDKGKRGPGSGGTSVNGPGHLDRLAVFCGLDVERARRDGPPERARTHNLVASSRDGTRLFD